MQNPDPEHLERGDGRAVTGEDERAFRVDLGPANSITVTGPPGGTLTVWAHGRAVEVEVSDGETSEQVASRLADALNRDGVKSDERTGGVLDVDLASGPRDHTAHRVPSGGVR